MGRLIKTETAGKDRMRLMRSLAWSLKTLTQHNDLNQEAKDILAYIVLVLREIATTIDLSVAAWEKRGYWVKADRFRNEWLWSMTIGTDLYNNLKLENWTEVSILIAKVAEKTSHLKLPSRGSITQTSWVGSWKYLFEKES